MKQSRWLEREAVRRELETMSPEELAMGVVKQYAEAVAACVPSTSGPHAVLEEAIRESATQMHRQLEQLYSPIVVQSPPYPLDLIYQQRPLDHMKPAPIPLKPGEAAEPSAVASAPERKSRIVYCQSQYDPDE